MLGSTYGQRGTNTPQLQMAYNLFGLYMLRNSGRTIFRGQQNNHKNIDILLNNNCGFNHNSYCYLWCLVLVICHYCTQLYTNTSRNSGTLWLQVVNDLFEFYVVRNSSMIHQVNIKVNFTYILSLQWFQSISNLQLGFHKWDLVCEGILLANCHISSWPLQSYHLEILVMWVTSKLD